MKLTVKQIYFHRNGIDGTPFYAVRFIDGEAEGDMLGVVFEAQGHVAVFDLHRLALADIGFDRNSWRGDEYETHLRKAIKELETKEMQS